MPRKELFEVFQSQGVPINDGKYVPPPDEVEEEVLDAPIPAPEAPKTEYVPAPTPAPVVAPPTPAPAVVTAPPAPAPVPVAVVAPPAQQVQAPQTPIQHAPAQHAPVTHGGTSQQKQKKTSPAYAIRKDTMIWVSVLTVLALTLSFWLGVNYGKSTLDTSGKIAQRSLESLEVAEPIHKAPVRKTSKKPRPTKPAVKKGVYALQIITYLNTTNGRKSAKNLVSFLGKRGFEAEGKKRGKHIVVLVGNYNSKTDARLASDKAALAKIKIKGRNEFKRSVAVKR